VEKAANAIIIEPAASEAVHRSGSGRFTSDAPPNSANRTAGDPTPRSTRYAIGRFDIMLRILLA
jgi:hypothetical protein